MEIRFLKSFCVAAKMAGRFTFHCKIVPLIDKISPAIVLSETKKVDRHLIHKNKKLTERDLL